ncbi:MAG TPA: hypothetical protein VD789_00775 [Thermomicrobiales bacterium]|nr:hypothetical protein [Thermomicrobiales bacterium]
MAPLRAKRQTGVVIVVAASTLLCIVLGLAGLTGFGARRRGAAAPSAVAAGLFFPVTWAVWYVRDERPYRRSRPPTPTARRP